MKRAAAKEIAVVWSLLLGVGSLIGGFYITFVVLRAGVRAASRYGGGHWGGWYYLGPGLMVLGLVLLLGGLLYGLLAAATENRGERRRIRNVFVMARYAVGRDGSHLTDPEQIEFATKPKYYVRLQIPGEGSGEFGVAPETFWNAPEGSRGTAEIAGKWLGSFRADPIPSQHPGSQVG